MEKDEKRFVQHNRGNNVYESRSVHYKIDKARGWRRRADRHTHHRRRNIMQSALKRGIEDYVLPPSSASHKGTGWGYSPIAQNKGDSGPRDQFYLESKKQKRVKRRWPEFFPRGVHYVRDKIPVKNEWHTVLEHKHKYDPSQVELWKRTNYLT
jgi:hypothetical protein